MKFKIASRIFQDYPGTAIGVVVAHNINNTQESEAIKKLLVDAESQVIATFKNGTIETHSHIAPWLATYQKFDVNPKKYPPSIYNLIQRVLKKPLRSINSAVDIYNVISLKYLLPAGGEDLDTIRGDLELTIAGDNETPVTLLGDTQLLKPVAGEVFYKDENGAVCRRWNWKEADRTKLTPQTHNAIFVLEALPPISNAIIESAAHELAQLIERYCGGTVSVDIMNAQRPEIELKKDNSFAKLNNYNEALIQESLVHTTKVSSEPVEVPQVDVPQEFQIRLEKVKKLQAQSINPWAELSPVTSTTHDILSTYAPEKESDIYTVAGRVMTIRLHGKTAFAHIQDGTDRLQIYIRQDVVGEGAFNFFHHMIDIGDTIWVKGSPFKTKTGEVTLKVVELKLLSKSLYPLPEKFHGLTDIEVKYRQRYLDLMSSQETREKFKKRSKIIQLIRDFLNTHSFIEVETPMLHPIPGGAVARPFITHHNTYDMDLYLRIAPELYLKRLVVGGFDRVYEINRNFRNEGISTRHNPEFTMLEFYIAYKDYQFMMDFVQEMLKSIIMHVNGTLQVPFGDHVINFEKPFARFSPKDALIHSGTVTKDELSPHNIDTTLKKHSVALEDKNSSIEVKIYALFEKLAEPTLIQPTYIIDLPIEVSPLARKDPKNPHVAARFELFVAGMEIANGFNELNDPFDQAERFKEQLKAHERGNAEAHHYDADYVHALEYGLPPTAGCGIGIDRFTMLLTNTTSIKDVILFPTLKMKKEAV